LFQVNESFVNVNSDTIISLADAIPDMIPLPVLAIVAFSKNITSGVKHSQKTFDDFPKAALRSLLWREAEDY